MHFNDSLTFKVYRKDRSGVPVPTGETVTLSGPDACSSPIHVWSIVYLFVRIGILGYACVYQYKTRGGRNMNDFDQATVCGLNVVRTNAVVNLINQVWFILGMVRLDHDFTPIVAVYL